MLVKIALAIQLIRIWLFCVIDLYDLKITSQRTGVGSTNGRRSSK